MIFVVANVACRQVVKACISMAYPPRLQAGPNQDNQFVEDGPPLPEAVPPAANPGRNQHDIVHLDIDPNNVFVAGYDGDHRDAPVFKVTTLSAHCEKIAKHMLMLYVQIADFGASDTVSGTRVDDTLPFYDTTQKWIWDMRSKGKQGYFLPVSFQVLEHVAVGSGPSLGIIPQHYQDDTNTFLSPNRSNLPRLGTGSTYTVTRSRMG